MLWKVLLGVTGADDDDDDASGGGGGGGGGGFNDNSSSPARDELLYAMDYLSGASCRPTRRRPTRHVPVLLRDRSLRFAI